MMSTKHELLSCCEAHFSIQAKINVAQKIQFANVKMFMPPAMGTFLKSYVKNFHSKIGIFKEYFSFLQIVKLIIKQTLTRYETLCLE